MAGWFLCFSMISYLSSTCVHFNYDLILIYLVLINFVLTSAHQCAMWLIDFRLGRYSINEILHSIRFINRAFESVNIIMLLLLLFLLLFGLTQPKYNILHSLIHSQWCTVWAKKNTLFSLVNVLFSMANLKWFSSHSIELCPNKILAHLMNLTQCPTN